MNQAHHFFFKKKPELFQGQKLDKPLLQNCLQHSLLSLHASSPNNTDQQFRAYCAAHIVFVFLTLYSGHVTCKKSNRKAFNQNKQNRKRTSKCRTVSTGAMKTHFQIRGRCSVGPSPGDDELTK